MKMINAIRSIIAETLLSWAMFFAPSPERELIAELIVEYMQHVQRRK